MDTYRIVWDEKLSVGDPLIDSQHKRLIELIASIPETEAEGDARVLEAVLGYAGKHFADEEALMERLGYPRLAAQKAAHRKLTMILNAHRKDYELGKTDFNEFKQFMFGWIRDHIMDEDKKISEFLASQKTPG